MLRNVKGLVEFLTLTENQRKLIGEKFLDFANIGSGGLNFWQCNIRRANQMVILD
jgi:hypothetical protein